MRATAPAMHEMKSLDDRFYCRAKRRVVMLLNCLDDYVDATSLEKRRSACYHCPNGRKHRDTYASSGEAD